MNGVFGQLELEHLVDAGVSMPDGDFETVAGFILSCTGRIPLGGRAVRVERELLH